MMTEDHVFIDRKGEVDKGRETMTRCWGEFFQSFPDYRNTFHRIHSEGNLVVLYGYGTWCKDGEPDFAIWTALIENDLVAEWRIYQDNTENRKRFNLENIKTASA
jgi:predicted SnoaL-like aldol condensation-catalyzing enzyme